MVQDEEPAVQAGLDQQQQYLTFMLGDETFAIGIMAVREIIEHGYVTHVPMSPDFICGVINLRGAVVPVIDLAARFGRSRCEWGKRSCIVLTEIVTDEGAHEMGLAVDAVSEVLELRPQDIEPPPEFGSRIRNDFVAGMGNINGRFVVLLDMARVLTPAEVTIAGMKERQVRAEPGLRA